MAQLPPPCPACAKSEAQKAIARIIRDQSPLFVNGREVPGVGQQRQSFIAKAVQSGPLKLEKGVQRPIWPFGGRILLTLEETLVETASAQ